MSMPFIQGADPERFSASVPLSPSVHFLVPACSSTEPAGIDGRMSLKTEIV